MFDPTLVTRLAWTLIQFISLELKEKNLQFNLETQQLRVLAVWHL